MGKPYEYETLFCNGTEARYRAYPGILVLYLVSITSIYAFALRMSAASECRTEVETWSIVVLFSHRADPNRVAATRS